jgi:hypothetical protein
MRSLLAGAVLVGALALVGAASASADHAYVFGGVTIYRGSGPAVSEYVSEYTTCSGTSCTVTVALGKRDYNRFVKWCGAASRNITVSPSPVSFGGYVECKGPPPWYLTPHVAMRNARDVLTAHSEAVTITVNVTP